MEFDAYKLGHLDAGIALGLTKIALRGLAPALSIGIPALAGYVAAPEGQGAEGAAAGAIGGSLLYAGARGLSGRKGASPAAPAAPAVGAPGGTTVLPKSAPVPAHAIPPKLTQIAEEHGVNPQALYPRAMQQAQTRQNQPVPEITQATRDASKHFGTDPAMVTALNAAPGPMKGAPMRHAPGPQMDADLQAFHGSVQPPGPLPQKTVPQQMDADLQAASNPPIPKKNRKKAKGGREVKASLEDFKIAVDVSSGVGVPGLGMSLGFRDQRERLPGMSRWVPRRTVERGFDYADEGLDPQAVADLEGERGTVLHPLLGAALAAAGARKFLPNSGTAGPVIAGLIGGGLGTLYNQATKDRRIEEGLEAHIGAQRERGKFPIRRHQTQTANEATPLAISRGSGDA